MKQKELIPGVVFEDSGEISDFAVKTYARGHFEQCIKRFDGKGNTKIANVYRQKICRLEAVSGLPESIAETVHGIITRTEILDAAEKELKRRISFFKRLKSAKGFSDDQPTARMERLKGDLAKVNLLIQG